MCVECAVCGMRLIRMCEGMCVDVCGVWCVG